MLRLARYRVAISHQEPTAWQHAAQRARVELAPHPEARLLVDDGSARKIWLRGFGADGMSLDGSLASSGWPVSRHWARVLTLSLSLLSNQGYQMAKNLQSKLPPTDSIRIFDINKASVQRLAEEMKTSQAGGAVVETAGSAYEAAEDSVRKPSFVSHLFFQHARVPRVVQAALDSPVPLPRHEPDHLGWSIAQQVSSCAGYIPRLIRSRLLTQYHTHRMQSSPAYWNRPM